MGNDLFIKPASAEFVKNVNTAVKEPVNQLKKGIIQQVDIKDKSFLGVVKGAYNASVDTVKSIFDSSSYITDITDKI